MIKKIKRYKINLRPTYVLRILKRKSQNNDPADELEQKVKNAISELQTLIQPSSIYQSFSQNDTPNELKPLWKEATAKSLSFSLIATTIGQEIEKRITNAKNELNVPKAHLLEAIALEGLDQSMNFAFKLINEEAKIEGCECTPLLPIDDAFLSVSLNFLQTEKIAITLDSKNQTCPLYTKVSISFWNPLSKK